VSVCSVCVCVRWCVWCVCVWVCVCAHWGGGGVLVKGQTHIPQKIIRRRGGQLEITADHHEHSDVTAQLGDART